MAIGEVWTPALTEPDCASDLQSIRSSAAKNGDDYVINGSKTWITNARKTDLIALLCNA